MWKRQSVCEWALPPVSVCVCVCVCKHALCLLMCPCITVLLSGGHDISGKAFTLMRTSFPHLALLLHPPLLFQMTSAFLLIGLPCWRSSTNTSIYIHCTTVMRLSALVSCKTHVWSYSVILRAASQNHVLTTCYLTRLRSFCATKVMRNMAYKGMLLRLK